LKCTIKKAAFVAIENDAVMGCGIESAKPKTKTNSCKWLWSEPTRKRHRITSKGITVFCNANGIKKWFVMLEIMPFPFI
jgi:hypothetical protein